MGTRFSYLFSIGATIGWLLSSVAMIAGGVANLGTLGGSIVPIAGWVYYFATGGKNGKSWF